MNSLEATSFANDLEEHSALASLISLGLTSQELGRLKKDFEYWQGIWHAELSQLPQEVHKKLSSRSQEVLEHHQSLIQKHGVTLVPQTNKEYPTLLKEISSPPFSLFVRGGSSCLNARFPIAVIGSRKINSYSKAVLHEIIPALVKAGATIVSGLAYGVDSLAHEIALDHGGHCIAVFGSGVDRIYPAEHKSLANRILMSGGSLLSEQPLGTAPQRHTFPARNRIISGLSKATLVIQAQEKSGSLITAEFATQQNRDVYAVPGDIFSEGQQGTNMLIAQGAYPIISSTDLLDRLNLLDSHHENAESKPQLSFDTPQEEKLYHLLSCLKSLESLQEESNMDIKFLNQTLSMMELKGLIRNLGGMRYIRT